MNDNIMITFALILITIAVFVDVVSGKQQIEKYREFSVKHNVSTIEIEELCK